MCGIAVCICAAEDSDAVLQSARWLQLLDNNCKRGPDSQRKQEFYVPVGSNFVLHLSFFVSTLHLRGSTPVEQPHVSDDAVLCWNGEIFAGIEIPLHQNDGSILFSALEGVEDAPEICRLLSHVEGPYALVYYQRKRRRLYFALDPLGRRSLLLHRPTEKYPFLSLSSVSAGPGHGCIFEELDSNYIYSIDISRLPSSDLSSLDNIINRTGRTLYPELSSYAAVLPVNDRIPENPPLPDSNSLSEDMVNAIDGLFNILDKSVDAQVRNIPSTPFINGSRVAVLFSGGIDSAVIAFFADRHVPPGEPIDLLNVAFENPRRVQLGIPLDGKQKPERNKEKRSNTSPYNEANVYDVPDRVSGLEELEELRRLCPNREWNFVEINVTYAESSQAKDMVQRIMYPSKTVMDLSLSLALYFLSKASGLLHNAARVVPYASPAKVLLSGLGSDELLGGYLRHQSVFKAAGWSGLIDELQLELDRIPTRNLGRDDRIVSHHGKEIRHPFLSLSLVNAVSQISVHLKTDPRLGLGSGDKMLLRLLAKTLGLEIASTRKKRAMQFGSCSARMEVHVNDRDGNKSLYE